MQQGDWICEMFRQLNLGDSRGRPAPHKPLLILYALSRYRAGADRFLPFSEVDEALRLLLRGLGCAPKTHYPFYRLTHDDIWDLKNNEDLLENRSGDVSRKELLEANVYGGFPRYIYDELDDFLSRSIAAIMFENLQAWTVDHVLEDLPLSFWSEEKLTPCDEELVARFDESLAELESRFGDDGGIEETLKSLEEMTYEVSFTVSLDRFLSAATRLVSQMFSGPPEGPASAKLLEAVEEAQHMASEESGVVGAAHEASNALRSAIQEYDQTVEGIHQRRVEGPDPQLLRDFWQFSELVHEVIESAEPRQRDIYRSRMYPLVIRVVKAEHTN